jgi:hypothetical protein
MLVTAGCKRLVLVSPVEAVLPGGARDSGHARYTGNTGNAGVLAVLPLHLVLRNVGAELLNLVGKVGNGVVDVLKPTDEVLAVLLSGDSRDSRHARHTGDAGDGALGVSEAVGGHRVEEEGHDGDEESEVLVHGDSVSDSGDECARQQTTMR